MGTFTIFAPRDAMHGDLIRIFVGDETMAGKEIMFGGKQRPHDRRSHRRPTVYTDGMVMVQSTISDPDGDTLTWEATSDDEVVATAMVDMDGVVTITAVAVGTANITVKATDPDGMYAMQSFMVTHDGPDGANRHTDLSVMAEATSHDMITVSWASPADDGGSDITGYMVTARRAHGRRRHDERRDGRQDPAHMGMDMMYMDSGLMAETTYYYRVAAMNAEGMGVKYSDGMAMATTDAPASTELTAPSGVVVSSLPTTQSVSVTWDTTSIQNAEQIKVVLFNSGVTAVAKPLITINAANDMGSATFNDVPDGMYNVVVASFRTGERHKLSPLQEVTVE